MKRFLAILGLLAAIAGVLLLLRTQKGPALQPGRQGEIAPAALSNSTAVQSRTSAVPSVSAPIVSVPVVNAQTDLASRAASPDSTAATGSSTNEPPMLPAATVLDKARVVIHNYHAAMGENPVGTNPEIAVALQGRNPKQINFLAESGLRLNGKGEIVDGFGTPFFFHQISGNEMEIRSAGPDKVMWTSDDMIAR